MYSARDIATRVRDGLLLLEERERQRPATLIEELEAEAEAGMTAVQNLVDGMARQRRLYIANGMREVIAAGMVPGGGAFSLLRWLEVQEAFDAFEQWLSTPLPGCGLPPIVIISRRGNPPEPPAPPPEPEPEPAPEEQP